MPMTESIRRGDRITEMIDSIELYLQQTREVLDRIEGYIRELKEENRIDKEKDAIKSNPETQIRL